MSVPVSLVPVPASLTSEDTVTHTPANDAEVATTVATQRRDAQRPLVTDPAALPYLLTVGEAATLLRTTEKAIYARAERGLLPGLIRDGRRILIERDELLRSLSERRTASSGRFRR